MKPHSLAWLALVMMFQCACVSHHPVEADDIDFENIEIAKPRKRPKPADEALALELVRAEIWRKFEGAEIPAHLKSLSCYRLRRGVVDVGSAVQTRKMGDRTTYFLGTASEWHVDVRRRKIIYSKVVPVLDFSSVK